MKSIKQIASSDGGDQEKELEQLRKKLRTETVNYFLNQWWVDGQYERWAERYRYASVRTLGLAPRVERIHGAMKGALASSSGTLYAAAKKINHSGIERSQQLSVISSNETSLYDWRSETRLRLRYCVQRYPDIIITYLVQFRYQSGKQ